MLGGLLRCCWTCSYLTWRRLSNPLCCNDRPGTISPVNKQIHQLKHLCSSSHSRLIALLQRRTYTVHPHVGLSVQRKRRRTTQSADPPFATPWLEPAHPLLASPPACQLAPLPGCVASSPPPRSSQQEANVTLALTLPVCRGEGSSGTPLLGKMCRCPAVYPWRRRGSVCAQAHRHTLQQPQP